MGGMLCHRAGRGLGAVVLIGLFLAGCTMSNVGSAPLAVPMAEPAPIPTPIIPLTPPNPPVPTDAPATYPLVDREAMPEPTPTAVSPAPSAPGMTRTLLLPYTEFVVGESAEGRPIEGFRFGDGLFRLVFVGGIHGGYEWNTIALAYEALDFFADHPNLIPASVTLEIIPSANPDGQYLITRQEGRIDPSFLPAADIFDGRFNARGVDLNRNWDCRWTPDAVWRNQPISGGQYPFSEPESGALATYFLGQRPALVVFWHSAADGVYASGCPETHAPSFELAALYGGVSGYPVYESFQVYPVTGDAGDWLTTQGVASFSVELINHEDTDWAKNLAGMKAILTHFDRQIY